jgi:hypothetical protein
VFFLKAEVKNVDVVLWTFFAFETLSGIKINYNKTELIPINLGQAEAQSLAALVGCTLTSFPITYLGIPLHDRKLRARD